MIPRWLVAFLLAGCASQSELVRVPAGSFVLGHLTGPADQIPPHRVTLGPFRIERTLVTNDGFAAFVQATGYVTTAERRGTGKTAILGMSDWEWREVAGVSWRAPWGADNARFIPLRGDMPVTMVSWFDAAAYCQWRGRRLPTEAEWEYAMRAGATTRFPWGDAAEALPARLNYWQGATHLDNSGADGWLYVSPVRTYPPNRWGIYDPAGNVWQWTADWYAPDTFAKDAGGVSDPRGPAEGTHKVARGGSWWCSAGTCHGYGLVTRGKTRPEASFSNNGFRCVSD